MAQNQVKVIIVGAAGRMGQRLLHALHDTSDILLAGAVERPDHSALGRDAGEVAGLEKWNIPLSGSLRDVVGAADAIIDFTNAEASLKSLQIAADHGKAAVIGSTGFFPAQIAQAEVLTRKIPCVLSPNMSVGVNVMFKIIGEVAGILGNEFDIEVVEAHHRMKKDAPSGTAMKMGQILARVLKRNFDEVGVFERKGIIGERQRAEIGMQSIRGGDIVGDHTVIFAGPGERLEIIHRANSRDNYARGAMRAVRWVVGQKPGLYDMQDVLGL